MDKRIKYNFKQKLSAVVAVARGRETLHSAARLLGCSTGTLQLWYKHYRQHGKSALKVRYGGYTGGVRVQVIEHMLNNNLSLSETAAFWHSQS